MVGILVHMAHFFKFVRHEAYLTNGGNGERHTEVCLSDIYRSSNFQMYEKVLYYLFFRIVPWLVVLLILPKIMIACVKRRLEAQTELPDVVLTRTLRSTRSNRIAVAVLLAYVICCAVAHVVYACAVNSMEFDQMLSRCRLTPSSRRFDALPAYMEFLYEFFLMFYSAIKFPLCCLASADVRRMGVQCICWPQNNSDRIKEGFVYIISGRFMK